MPDSPIVLANSYLRAEFSHATGALVRLTAANSDETLVKGISCRYFARRGSEAGVWHGEGLHADDHALFPSTRTTHGKSARGAWVETELDDAHVHVRRHFDLDARSPLLRVRTQVTLKKTVGKGDGKYTIAGHPSDPKGITLYIASFPETQYADDFLDAFEDHQDLCFDGAEVGKDRELPAWRVLYKPGHETGVIVATRSKACMANFDVLARGFRVYPHLQWNYTSHVPRPGMTRHHGTTFTTAFEIGPWSKSGHAGIVRAAQLDKPVVVKHERPTGKKPRGLKGKVFYAAQFAGSAASTQFKRNKWMTAKAPWAAKGKLLFAGPGVQTPKLVLKPKLKGIYRMHIGIANGAGVSYKLSGDPHLTFRVTDADSAWELTAFSQYLSGKHTVDEVDAGVARMDGQHVILSRYPSPFTASVIDYVRFEKLTPAQEQRWREQQNRKPCVELSGLNDIPDIAPLTNDHDPDPDAYASNVWEHARSGFKKIFWRIDGQCADFPSKTNTMRYISAKTHGVFTPTSKAYGRVLLKTDILKLAVEAGRKYGVEIWGWMRFNNYTGNVQSDFFKKNPQFREEWEHARPAAKLCLALPEVRKHKIDILVEAAAYGLQGLNLGFLRHPPILLYHPVLVEGYKQKYGVLPPRNPQAKDARLVESFPPNDEEHTRWYAYRAQFMTLFGQELRAALSAANLSHVKVSLWLRPNHVLFDGIDLPAWLEQGLCDEVVADMVAGADFDNEVNEPQPQWLKMVQAKVPVVRGIPCSDLAWVKKRTPEFLKQGYTGLCTYESDMTVLDSAYIDYYQSLRK